MANNKVDLYEVVANIDREVIVITGTLEYCTGYRDCLYKMLHDGIKAMCDTSKWYRIRKCQ